MRKRDVTFFYGEKRIVTFLEDQNGDKILGSPAGDVIVQKVLEQGEEYFTSMVSVNGVRYYGYYIPVKQSATGQLIKSTAYLKESLLQIVSTLSNHSDSLGESSAHMDEILENTLMEVAKMEEAMNGIVQWLQHRYKSLQNSSKGLRAISSSIMEQMKIFRVK